MVQTAVSHGTCIILPSEERAFLTTGRESPVLLPCSFFSMPDPTRTKAASMHSFALGTTPSSFGQVSATTSLTGIRRQLSTGS